MLGPAFDHTSFPGLAALFMITHPSDVVDGRRVRFVERNLAVIWYWLGIPGARVRGLLVSADSPDLPGSPGSPGSPDRRS
jgi:hypothetical protein